MYGEDQSEKYVMTFPIKSNDFINGGEASTQIKKTLQSLGIAAPLMRKVTIIAYEAEMNLVIHSYGGEISLEVDENKISIKTKDQGPGISDINQAMEEGYTTVTTEILEMGFGAGMGLSNINNFSDELYIDSEVNVGTFLSAVVYL